MFTRLNTDVVTGLERRTIHSRPCAVCGVTDVRLLRRHALSGGEVSLCANHSAIAIRRSEGSCSGTRGRRSRRPRPRCSCSSPSSSSVARSASEVRRAPGSSRQCGGTWRRGPTASSWCRGGLRRRGAQRRRTSASAFTAVAHDVLVAAVASELLDGVARETLAALLAHDDVQGLTRASDFPRTRTSASCS